MILVDSSVWIDVFNGAHTPQSDKLDQRLGVEPLTIGDGVLTEVLQGFGRDRDFNRAPPPAISPRQPCPSPP